MTTPLTIWTNHRFAPPLAERFRDAVAPHVVRVAASMQASVLVPAESDPRLRDDADVAFGQPVVEDLLVARKLKLVCLSSAGYTRYDRDDLRAHCKSMGLAICNASAVYDEPCAQHAMAMILAVCRQLPAGLDSQRGDRAWPTSSLRAASRLLSSSTRVAIVGYGAIARRLVELLAPFGVQIEAFRRSPRGDENCKTFAMDRLDAFLPDADHVVNLLPASASTANFFDAARLAWLKPGAAFYNIGRGDTVDQVALAAGLRSDAIGHAYLDVTTPEPLPPDHPLWTTSNCVITPHTAGGSADEGERQIEHFAEQLDRFANNERLLNRIL